MFGNPSLNTRIAVGKTLGALFGLAGFIYLTVYPVGDDSLLRWGILLWYTTLGAIIGVFGVYTWDPVLKLPMPWVVSRTPFGGVDELRADVLCL